LQLRFELPVASCRAVLSGNASLIATFLVFVVFYFPFQLINDFVVYFSCTYLSYCLLIVANKCIGYKS